MLRFADDIALITKNEKEMEIAIKDTEVFRRIYELKIN